MWNNIRSGLAVLVATLLIGVGIVQSGTGTVTIKDASGTTQTYAIVTDGSGHFIAEHVICDYSAGANCAAVNSSHQLTTLEANSAAILSAIQNSIPAGSALIGGAWLIDAAGTNKATVKAASTPPATTDTALVTALLPATPMTPIVAAASDNHAVIKNGAGVAFSVHASNNSATANYARLYDAGTGFNGCNSATGVIFAFEIPPSNSGFTISLGGSRGIAFSNGLSFCITSGFGLTDTTNATASAIYFNASYN